MSTLNILGGVGKGIMQGQDHIARQDQNKASIARSEQQAQFDRARLGALNEQMTLDRDDRKRTETLQGIYRQYGDKDWSDPKVHEAMTREAMPFMTPQEIAAVQQQSAALRQVAGAQAVDRFMFNNDLSGFAEAVERNMPGAKLTEQNGVIMITGPDGGVQQMDARGLAVMLGMNGALERIGQHEAGRAAGDKARLENDKLRSETNKNNRMYGFVTNPDGTQSYVGSGAGARGAAKPFDPVGSQKDYNAAWSDGNMFDKERGHALYQQLSDNNKGMTQTQSGHSGLLYASKELAEGNAEVRPVLMADGTLELRAKIGPNDYVLESNVPESRMIELMRQYQPVTEDRPGFFANLIGSTPEAPVGVDEQFIGQMYLDTLRDNAVTKPQEFAAAWQLANDEEAFAAAIADARAANEPGLVRLVQAAGIIQRGLHHAREQAPQTGKTVAPTGNVSSENPSAGNGFATALGVKPQTKGFGEQLIHDTVTAGHGLAEGIGSVVRTAVGANPYQRAWRVENEIEDYRRAKTSGNSSLIRHHAERLYEMAKGDEELEEKVLRALGLDKPKPITIRGR